MNIMNSPLLAEIEAYIEETGMGAAYFGRCAAQNSELVKRLRGGGRVWPETEAKIRAYILMRRASDRKAAKSAPENSGAGR